jgi:hypothetical protein
MGIPRLVRDTYISFAHQRRNTVPKSPYWVCKFLDCVDSRCRGVRLLWTRLYGKYCVVVGMGDASKEEWPEDAEMRGQIAIANHDIRDPG